MTSIHTCRQLKEVYRAIAQSLEVGFLAASDIVEPSSVDDEHMTAKGHRRLAQTIYEKLAEMNIV